MAFTLTEICNQALARVGAQPIMDINDEESKGARVCKNTLDTTIREVARAGDWNCLRKRDTLAQLATPPAFEWAFQYQLPTDFINLVELNGVSYVGEQQDDWEIEGDKLLTDADRADVKYTAYSDKTIAWDPLFTNAIVVLLASRIAVSIRQDEGMAANLLTEYNQVALPQARTKDANQKRRARYDPCEGSRFLQSRYFSTNG